MNKSDKRRKSILEGGIGSNVVDGDLNLAIRIWKQEFKNSGVLREIKERSEFTPKSKIRRTVVDKAKYRNTFM